MVLQTLPQQGPEAHSGQSVSQADGYPCEDLDAAWEHGGAILHSRIQSSSFLYWLVGVSFSFWGHNLGPAH